MNKAPELLLAVVLILCLNPVAFSKGKYVNYEVRASAEQARAETTRYFVQMGYIEDRERTKQCNLEPKPNLVILRHTGEGQSGISGLSRCLSVTVTPDGPITSLSVAVSDHLRGGLSLPATAHYGSKWIHREYDAAFAEITHLLEHQ